jgi:SCY1-like protein 2
MSKDEFQKGIYPLLKLHVFKIVDPPQQTLLVLHKIDLFVKSLTDETFRVDVVPFVLDCISSSNTQIQISSLRTIAVIQPKIDFLTLKKLVLPKIETHFSSKSAGIQSKTVALLAIAALLPNLDKPTISECVLPILEKEHESDQSYIMALLEIFKSITGMVDYFETASRIIPHLWKISLDPSLTIGQVLKINIVSADMRVYRWHVI